MTDKNIPLIIAEDEDIAHWSAWSRMSEQSKKMLEQAEIIKKLIWLIEDDDLRAFTYFILSQSHPTFWSIPSSSSGKYHPEYENGDGGLIRHIKVVMALALNAMRRFGYSHEYQSDANQNAKMRDIIAFAVITHDWGKNGHPLKDWGKFTTKTHGEDTAKIIEEELLPKFIKFFPEIKNQEELKDMVQQACFSIQHHYGIWSKEKLRPSDEKLNDIARIVHEADYYSSRKIFASIDNEEIEKTYAENSPAYVKRCT